jgi:uncharacterized delta-60 repeat protein
MRIPGIFLAITIAVFALGARAASMLDTTFSIGTGANGIVEQVQELPDGKVLICGNFTSFNGSPRGYIARLNANGSVDEAFNASPSYWVRHFSVQTDGKIVIGGFFTSVGGMNRNRLARLNADGSLDTAFNVGAGIETIIAAGIDGNIDPFVFWTELQADGKILATGNFRTYDGASSQGLVRINTDGSRDATFNVGNGLNSWGRTIRVMTNNQVLVGGWFTEYNARGANRLVRINPDGSRDLAMDAYYGDKTAVYAIAVLADGKMITSGHSLNEERLFERNIVRLNANGTVDGGWVGSSNEKTESLTLLRDGKVIAGGYFNQLNGQRRTSIGRFNLDGTVDQNFAAEIDNFVWTVAMGRNGKFYISGGFTTVDGVSRRGVARMSLPEGTGPGGTPTAPEILLPRLANGRFQATVNSQSGFTYVLQHRSPSSAIWTSLAGVSGSGSQITLTDPTPAPPRFYRVEVR